MGDSPRVTVVVISHRPEFNPIAMKSAFNQTYPNVEVLCKFHREYWPDKLNESWQGASGKYLVFLPDDDRLEPEYVRTLVSHLDGRNRQGVCPDGDMAYSDYYSEKQGYRFNFPFPPDITRESLRMWCVPHMTFMVRAEFWRSIGGWDGALLYSDWDASIRMFEAGAKIAHVREFLYFRGVHGEAGSVLMDHDAHAAALAALKAKHAAFFAGTD